MNLVKSKSVCNLFVDAIESGSEFKLKHLVEQGLDINTQDNHGMTSLMYTIYEDFSFLNLIIKLGADINQVNSKKQNTLMLGLLHGISFENAKILIDAGTNLNLVNDDKWNVLMLVVQTKNVELLKYILAINKNLDLTQEQMPGEDVFYLAKLASDTPAYDLLTIYQEMQELNSEQQNTIKTKIKIL